MHYHRRVGACRLAIVGEVDQQAASIDVCIHQVTVLQCGGADECVAAVGGPERPVGAGSHWYGLPCDERVD
jgi:hypothetical protein